MFKQLIPLFSLKQLYNLYFLFVVKRTFNACLMDNSLTFHDIESDFEKQYAAQEMLCRNMIKLASSYPEFSSVKLVDKNGKQKVNDPITKDFYRSVDSWGVRQGFWRKSAYTSGSSGVSLKITRSPGAFLNSQISFYRFFTQFGISRFDRNIYVGGARKAQLSIIDRLKTWIWPRITGMHKFIATDMVTDENFQEFIHFFETVRPIYIHGFSSALLRIAHFIENEEIQLNWVPKLVHPNAEGISATQREVLQRVFKCPVAMVYGSAECHMASECAHGTMHLNMRSCDIKINSDGLAVLTAFDSDVMPFVNYQMGDVVEIESPKSPCACGKHTTVITKIIGRLSDRIVLPSNRVLTHPDLNMLIEQIDGKKSVIEYQIIHYSGSNQVEIRCITNGMFDQLSFLKVLNARFFDVSFVCSAEPFVLLPNGKKPIMLTLDELPSLRSTYDSYRPYAEISESQNKINSDNLLKLDWNESTIDFPPTLKAMALEELGNIPLNYYPDLQASTLKRAIGKWLEIDEECITVFNGSDAGIATISRLFLEDSDTVITIEPTYGNYRAIASRYTKNIKTYQLEYPFIIDLPSFSEYIERETPKLIFFTNPNNPTGVEFQRELLFDLARRFSRTCFVIDEAYVEFGTNPLKVTGIPLNVIVLRTFSKAFGLAGIRLGYSLASKDLAVKIGFSKDNKEVDVFAQIMGTLAVNHPQYMLDYLEDVKLGRALIISFFTKHNIPYLAGAGNFILFKVAKPFEVEQGLISQNIFIRNRTEVTNLEGYLRVTLGGEAVMRQFTSALELLV